MTRRVILALVGALVLLVAGITAAVALTGDDLPPAAITEDEAVAAATAVVDGTVLEVELEKENGVVAYEVEIQTADGSVQEVVIDPDTAEVLSIEADDDVPGEPDDDGPDDDDSGEPDDD